MFNKDFYPTDEPEAHKLTEGLPMDGKIIFEPEAGKGDLVDFLQDQGATVIACELNDELRTIVETKCKVIGSDCLKITSDQISHVDAIVMNPPFSEDAKHILHMFEIAPAGCEVRALCNSETILNPHNTAKKQLAAIIEASGGTEDLGQCFTEAERKTGVNVHRVTLKKAGESYKTEFEGFLMDDEPEESQENGIMEYNAVREIVMRYINAVKLFDQQLELGVKMNALTSSFYSSDIAFHATADKAPVIREDFKKDLQKSGWKWIINKMNLNKYATKGLREDINKFVETQQQFPFTMPNIYAMLQTIVGTAPQRLDKALLEVFDNLTKRYDDNRHNVEGWKTNSHYVMGKKFILPYITQTDKWSSNEIHLSIAHGYHVDYVEDLVKVLCHMTAEEYDYRKGLSNFFRDNKTEYGKWTDWGFFRVKGFKKGTMHFEFKDDDLWGKVNQRIAKLKGFPLYEHKETKETKKRDSETAKNYRPPIQAEILFEATVK